MDREALTIAKRQMDYQDRGQWLGFGICILFLAMGGWLAYSGHDLAACTFVGTAAVGLAAIFVKGYVGNKRNPDDPEKASDPIE